MKKVHECPNNSRVAQRKATNLAMWVLGWWGVALTSILLQECNWSRYRNGIGHAIGMELVTLKNAIVPTWVGNWSRFRNWSGLRMLLRYAIGHA